MAVTEDLHLARVASGELDKPTDVYPGLVDVAMASQGKEHAKPLAKEKFDIAYARWKISLDEWARLYNIMNELPADTPLSIPPPERDKSARI